MLHCSLQGDTQILNTVQIWCLPKEKSNTSLTWCAALFKATPRFELGIRVLQTHALPLGYIAIDNIYYNKVVIIRQYIYYVLHSFSFLCITYLNTLSLSLFQNKPYRIKQVRNGSLLAFSHVPFYKVPSSFYFLVLSIFIIRQRNFHFLITLIFCTVIMLQTLKLL